MVRIYKNTESKNVNLGDGWIYWSSLKNDDGEKYVWYKEVTQEEAGRYELEKDLLN